MVKLDFVGWFTLTTTRSVQMLLPSVTALSEGSAVWRAFFMDYLKCNTLTWPSSLSITVPVGGSSRIFAQM